MGQPHAVFIQQQSERLVAGQPLGIGNEKLQHGAAEAHAQHAQHEASPIVHRVAEKNARLLRLGPEAHWRNIRSAGTAGLLEIIPRRFIIPDMMG